jgi:zeaxanthin glucosyltransferase
MRHFVVLAPPFLSHVRALEALAGELLTLGHRVSWVHQADVKPLIRDARIEFRAVGALSHPAGSLARTVRRAANPGGPIGLRRVIADVAASTDMLCREAPAVLRDLAVDAVIADQMEAAGSLVAESLGLPYVSVACALPVNREPRVPLPVMPWGYAKDLRGEQLNEGSTAVYDWLMKPHAKVISGHARAFGLRPRSTLAECLSPLAQLSQSTPLFDFPRMELPPHFHYVGPIRPPLIEEGELKLPLKNDRPFVFASLGTLQGGRFALFRRIALACKALDVQLLVAHCNGLDASQEATLNQIGATWVTGFAPQRAALARADAVITHAGLNTVLDALAAGTPMLALPIAFDQPGTAARVVHAGAGLRLLPALSGVRAMTRALQRVLDEPSFAARASLIGRETAGSGGAAMAADIALAAVERGRPVTASVVREPAPDMHWEELHAA